MKITDLKIRNFRTLENLELQFPSSYAAICGANDSGKTNVVRAIRALVKEDSRLFYDGFRDQEELSLKDDFPKWLDVEPSKRSIEFEIAIALDQQRDAGFYQVVVKQLSLEGAPSTLSLVLNVTYRADRPEPAVIVRTCGKEYGDLDAQEVLKKLQSSSSILFHNSTEMNPRVHFHSGSIRDISSAHEPLVASMKKTVNRGLAKISRVQQTEFEGLLGRLKTKYKVGLTMPAFDFGYFPFRITLGDKQVEVALDDWGSGTKNRTLILLTLFRARQIGEAEASAGKITPVIIVEEPESFLHPSAQAEFGRILHDLAEEFQVQVIVTTHSPYLLSGQRPTSNILLRRRMTAKQARNTERVEVTHENWMIPFAQALGLDDDEFKAWKPLMMSASNAVLLVEGDLDREYFELLRGEAHGQHRLIFDGEILPYDGTGNLKNTVLLRFIKNRYSKFFVTFDLDAADHLEKGLQALKLERGKHYLPIGLSSAGKRSIEGLLPDSVSTAVYGANPALVQAATSGSREEQESARNRLKRLLLEEFKRVAQPGSEHYGHFHPVVKTINKALG